MYLNYSEYLCWVLMRFEKVVLQVTCTQSCIRLRNDLYCVEWGVKGISVV